MQLYVPPHDERVWLWWGEAIVIWQKQRIAYLKYSLGGTWPQL
jgi:hypothetical protein